ncbi:hypothetical protein [Microbacterium sp. SLBN-146]|uniref:hypothetical protein n=1 Tax=Microbacterium sp. SLBN-146 TaxID=2768457 RepID=UPI00114F263C|nr:hypothetical protein [Microbacterium sp. SLBN-146]TQJ32232.1 hypothetical protein FBY39_2737 [Microbacterium sp. SLBN-146]
MTRRLLAAALICAATVATPACSSIPDAPRVVGEDYPGTCMPAELTWPTDFLESLPGESSAVGGSIVGLRLEYRDSRWAWRLRSVSAQRDAFGESVADRTSGQESIVDVRTLELLATREVELTEAEQRTDAIGASEAAQLSGEGWPSPLIVDMARVMQGEESVWRITLCDTEANELSVITRP